MNAEQGFWLQLTILIMVLSVWGLLKVLAAYRQFQQSPELLRIGKPLAAIGNDVQTVAGAGTALAQPPDLGATHRILAEQAPAARYRFPLGWSVLDGRPALSQAAFVGDVNHILLTAQSDGGKDTWAIGVLLGLAACHPPHELQLCLVDGKGLDFVGWRNLPHVWRVALTPGEIAPAMQALSAERERRRRILSAA